MTRTPVRLARAGVVLSSGLVVVLGLALALAQPSAPAASLLVAVAAALLAVALASRSAAVPPSRSIRIGLRYSRHAESLTERCAPAHPDTAGRVRSRAPGSVAPTAGP
ncbi:MAG: hypothetical protein HY996_06605 [Micrococcales bacterium]|nr:hypothetical protein [Micrococcales bacterium]